MASIVAARKLVDTLEDEEYDDDLFQTEAMNLSSQMVTRPASPLNAPTSPKPPAEREPTPPPHPPIVLRICKGTAQIITPPYLTDDESTSSHKREGRRRSYGSDSNDSFTPPKKQKSKCRDYEKREAEKADLAAQKELRSLEELRATLEGNTDEEVKEKSETDEVKAEAKEEPEEKVPTCFTEEPVEKEKDTTNEEKAGSTSEDCQPLTPEAGVQSKDEPNSETVETETKEIEPAQPSPQVEPSTETGPPNEEEVIQRVEPLVLRRPPGRTAKKGSIFKSRGASGEKRNAHYIHKWCDQKEEGKLHYEFFL